VLAQLKSVLGQFSPTFEMVPLTNKGNAFSTGLNAFEAQVYPVGGD